MSDDGLLDNHGSAARDHLANERTLLAWVRTGLGVIGLGIVLEKLVEVGTAATVAGVALTLYGIGILIYALVRFERVQRALRRGMFPVAKRGPMLLGALGLLLGIGAVAVLFL